MADRKLAALTAVTVTAALLTIAAVAIYPKMASQSGEISPRSYTVSADHRELHLFFDLPLSASRSDLSAHIEAQTSERLVVSASLKKSPNTGLVPAAAVVQRVIVHLDEPFTGDVVESASGQVIPTGNTATEVQLK